MNTISTSIDGVLIIEPKVFKDDRGFFYESWKASSYQMPTNGGFKQDNISFSIMNVLRGLHYQKGQGQIVSVLKGKIQDVIVDLRPSSKTFKQYVQIEISDEKVQQIYMPPGCAHGFWVMSEYALMSYKCSQIYIPNDELHIRWNDPELAIKWPERDFIISDKDRSANFLSDILSELDY